MGYRIWLRSPHDGRPYVFARASGRVGRTACELPKVYGVSVGFHRLDGRSGADTWRALERARLMLGTTPTGSALSDDNVGRACQELAAWARTHPEGTWRVELIDRTVRVNPNDPQALDRRSVE